MKITGIDSTLSTPTRVALITDPPIDADIFDAIESMTCADRRSPLEPPTPLLSSLRLANHNGRLIVNVAPPISDHIAHNIQVLLDAAESRANSTKQSRKENAEATAKAYQDQKQALIQSATSAFQIPPK